MATGAPARLMSSVCFSRRRFRVVADHYRCLRGDWCGGQQLLVVCRNFPDGGGVIPRRAKPAARRARGFVVACRSPVTAALSGWSGLSYITAGAEDVTWIRFLREHIALSTIAPLFLIMGLLNFYGPKHSGTLAVASLSVPTTLVVVLVLIALSAPHLTTEISSAAPFKPSGTVLGPICRRDSGPLRRGVDRQPDRRDETR